METKNWKTIAITTIYRFLRVFIAGLVTELGLILANQELVNKLVNEFSFPLLQTLVILPIVSAGIASVGKAIRETTDSDFIKNIIPF